MTRRVLERFHVRDLHDVLVARYPQRRHAMVCAHQIARKNGHAVEVFDSMALVGDVEAWSVFPSGKVESLTLRSVEAAPDDSQAGAER